MNCQYDTERCLMNKNTDVLESFEYRHIQIISPLLVCRMNNLHAGITDQCQHYNTLSAVVNNELMNECPPSGWSVHGG